MYTYITDIHHTLTYHLHNAHTACTS